jgi:hypothetical protein
LERIVLFMIGRRGVTLRPKVEPVISAEEHRARRRIHKPPHRFAVGFVPLSAYVVRLVVREAKRQGFGSNLEPVGP